MAVHRIVLTQSDHTTAPAIQDILLLLMITHVMVNYSDTHLAYLLCVITMSDIIECDDPRDNNCAQICINTMGSYTCDCRNGYRLNRYDGYTCNGIKFVILLC